MIEGDCRCDTRPAWLLLHFCMDLYSTGDSYRRQCTWKRRLSFRNRDSASFSLTFVLELEKTSNAVLKTEQPPAAAREAF